MDNCLSPEVQMQFLRPDQLWEAGKKCPVVYVPFGLIEWHGRHLPLGNDALKAHGILVKAAEQYGGVVYPPVFFHAGFDMDLMVAVITALFQRLKQTGFRVIMGITGHNTEGQVEMITRALEPVLADGTIVGMGTHEYLLSKCEESSSDHAAKWETSNMMFLYPDRVDMNMLPDGPMNLDMKPPHGIGGLDPREHASAAVGERNVELASAAIGKKAQELLNTLPEDQRGFNQEIKAEKWWCV
jgi:creatinine amidohydrolase